MCRVYKRKDKEDGQNKGCHANTQYRQRHKDQREIRFHFFFSLLLKWNKNKKYYFFNSLFLGWLYAWRDEKGSFIGLSFLVAKQTQETKKVDKCGRTYLYCLVFSFW